ncbi:DUF4118 domain-containing protein [Microlunatus speluncae]|uniref:DUF4118 domain-containing protein n=1 Tax=Microlunatus speluncae TaxID=2594267 RepID=UPI001FE5FD29|nr:DUF4118 domain-containing protein [Microlunatus speluncae]
MVRSLLQRTSVIITAALVAPIMIGWLLSLVRDQVDNANAALVLVLVVVGVAATGRRLAGIVAALSATVWFDFFLTEPYLTFTINDQNDIETAVLLTLVGLAVTEVALWGRRHQARASRREGYLAGVITAARTAVSGRSEPEALVAGIAEQIGVVLEVDRCVFEPGSSSRDHDRPRLQQDGSVTVAGRTVDVDRYGLPTDDLIELPVERAGIRQGRFMITAATRVSRPTLEQRQVAVTLADQAAAGLAATAS